MPYLKTKQNKIPKFRLIFLQLSVSYTYPFWPCYWFTIHDSAHFSVWVKECVHCFWNCKLGRSFSPLRIWSYFWSTVKELQMSRLGSKLFLSILSFLSELNICYSFIYTLLNEISVHFPGHHHPTFQTLTGDPNSHYFLSFNTWFLPRLLLFFC